MSITRAAVLVAIQSAKYRQRLTLVSWTSIVVTAIVTFALFHPGFAGFAMVNAQRLVSTADALKASAEMNGRYPMRLDVKDPMLIGLDRTGFAYTATQGGTHFVLQDRAAIPKFAAALGAPGSGCLTMSDSSEFPYFTACDGSTARFSSAAASLLVLWMLRALLVAAIAWLIVGVLSLVFYRYVGGTLTTPWALATLTVACGVLLRAQSIEVLFGLGVVAFCIDAVGPWNLRPEGVT
jgi:hypothetical protein